MSAINRSQIRKTNKLINKGVTAEVYVALDISTNQRYALKLINKQTIDQKYITPIRREIEIVMTLDHPHIVRTYDVIETPRSIKILMELFSGNLLEFYQRNGRLNEYQAYIIFRQIASAIDYLHNEKHIVHRDIKLANILFNNDQDMTVVLADFGFAIRREPTDPLITNIAGTPRYMAPELKSRSPNKGYPADIYALGICLYTLVVGEYPDHFLNLNKVQTNSSLPNLLRRMLDQNEDGRLTIREVINHPWMLSFHPGE